MDLYYGRIDSFCVRKQCEFFFFGWVFLCVRAKTMEFLRVLDGLMIWYVLDMIVVLVHCLSYLWVTHELKELS